MPEFVDKAVKEIDDRLHALKDEAARLEAALAALTGGRRRQGRPAGDGSGRAATRSSARRDGRSSVARAQQRTNTRADQARVEKAEPKISATRTVRSRRGSDPKSDDGGRTARGATRASVLAALAGGEAMTAGQVATKAGLARPTVSTTLSKLTKSGEVQKAERGYRITSAA